MNNECTHIAYGERLASEYAAARDQHNKAVVVGDSRWAMEGTLHAARVMRAMKRNAASHAAECESWINCPECEDIDGDVVPCAAHRERGTS